ncbi:hypothetical protein ACLOJK_039692 [Asimina triloba]
MGRKSGWLALLLFFFSTFGVPTVHGADTIRQGESLRDGQTLVSSGNKFELGFFSPSTSQNRYLGIWFKQPSVRAVAWVANRENYLSGSSSVLRINGDGNLVIHDGGGKSITLTAVSAAPTNSSSATLLDNGNFILKNEAGEVWQSFDYPTNTFLAGMKIGVDKKLGRSWSLVSWRSPDDPAPGYFSYQPDSEAPFRILIRQNGSIYWSSGTWNGAILSLIPEMKRGDAYTSTYISTEDEEIVTISLNFNDTMTPSRIVLDSSGQLQHLLWVQDPPQWIMDWAQPRDECDEYNACGPNARCNISDSLSCNCLQGFSPAGGGQLSKSSGRCVRQTKLKCGREDGFYPVDNIKFPDQSLYEPYPNFGVRYCESRCRSNCSCTAFASASSHGTGGCMFWSGDLIGLRDFPVYTNGDGFATGNLYIRLAESDIAAMYNSRKKKRHIGVIIGVVAPLLVLGFIFCYLLRRKVKSKGRREAIGEVFSFQRGNIASTTANNENYLDHGQTSGLCPPFFSFATVEAATDNFAPSNKLGQGGFGSVYKGQLAGGQEIAVKRLSRSSGQGLEEFRNEVVLISKVQHRNLVRVLGWSVHGEEKILIYEYMPNKSLDSILFDQTKKLILDWGKRAQIIEGIAQGLLYLHRYSRLRIIHRDLKASNILLDNDMNPKISDFGMEPVLSVLLATFAGFGVAMCGNCGLIELLRWRRRWHDWLEYRRRTSQQVEQPAQASESFNQPSVSNGENSRSSALGAASPPPDGMYMV